MKAPKVTDLSSKLNNEDTHFDKAVEIQQRQSTDMKRSSYTLEQRHIDIINNEAMRLSKERGKQISASATLRLLIERAVK